MFILVRSKLLLVLPMSTAVTKVPHTLLSSNTLLTLGISLISDFFFLA